MQQAGNVASTPYQGYNGQLVAPVNSQQTAGINNINSNAGSAAPYVNQAAGLASSASNPLTASQISNYQSPYTQQVVNATQAQFNDQNAQQQAALTGNQIAQGALGGNRSGIAASNLAGQQQLSQAPVIAGLENQGYTNALQTAAQQYQQNPLAAANSIANFGISGQNAALQGANAQVGAGTLQQQTQQQQDTAGYNQFQLQQAYPFQQTQWLAGLDTALGGAEGSTSSGTTTAPPPNQTSQYLGLGLLGASLLNRGGVVHKADAGGIGTGYGGFPYGVSSTPWGNVQGYIPTGQISGGHPSSSPFPQSPNTGQSSASSMNLGQLSSLFKNNSNSGGFTIPGNNAFADSMNDTIQDLSDAFARGGFVRGYADGGDPTTMDDRFAPVTVDRFAPMIDALQAGAFASQGANSADFKGTAGMDAANRGAVPLPVARNTTDAPVADDDDDAAATTPAVATPTAGISQPAPNGTANAGLAQPAPASSDSGSSWWTPNLRAGLLSAGLGMLASRSPFLGVAVGEGGLQGLKTYGEAEAADTKSKQDAIKQKMDERRLEFEAQRIQQTAQAQQFSQATSPLIRGPDGKMMTNPAYIAEKTAEAGIKDKVPVGYRETKDGNYEAIPGGPADPAVLKAAAEAKRVANAVLDDDTIHDMAGQYLAGDRTVMQNLGRGAQGAENIVKLRQEIAKQAREAGVDPKGIVNKFNEQAGALAGQRAVGTRAANISLAANEANNMIPIALAASDKLPRTQFMPWNQMVQSVQKGMSSPELASFVAATNSLVNSYVRAVSPSGVPTDSMRQHAYDMLNAAQGPEAYKAVIATMKQEMDAALRAPSQVQEELRRGTSAPTAVPTEVPQQGAVPTGAVGRRTDTSGREWYVDGAGKPLALVSP